MAYPCNPGHAGIHSPPCSNRTRIKKWRFASHFSQALSMVYGIAFASSALYRPRPEAGAHSFASGKLEQATRTCQMAGRASARPDMRKHVLRRFIVFWGRAVQSTARCPVGPTGKMAVLQPQNRFARNRCINSRIFSRTSNNSARKASSRSGGSKSFCATFSAAAMLVCK